MRLTLPKIHQNGFDYAWITSALLILFLSSVPFLLPMADRAAVSTFPDYNAPPARPHNRVVLLLVDGLAYRRAVDPDRMPYLLSRMRLSAAGTALASFPTITPSGLRSIIAGHRNATEAHDPNAKRSAEADSVLLRASKAGLKCFVIGPPNWEALFPNGHGAELKLFHYKSIWTGDKHAAIEDLNPFDEQVFAAADPIVDGKRGPWDLLVLHLFQSDLIGHDLGTARGFHPAHLRWLDRKIEEFSRRVGEQRPTTFLLLADHGHTDEGTHGGLSKEEREVPFVIWGSGVIPGSLGEFPLYDAAPTLAAMLGIQPPAAAEGWPHYRAFRTTPRQRADILRDLLKQRLAVWDTIKSAYSRANAGQENRLAEVDRLYGLGKYDVAAAVAEHSTQALDKAIDGASPKFWLWRIVAALWALILSACFGLAWSKAEIRKVQLAAALSAACLFLLLFPMLRPQYWAWTSALVLATALGLMILTLSHGLQTSTTLSRFEWSLWWLAVISIAFQEFVDVSLWSWLVILGLFISRALHLTRQNAVGSAIGLVSVLLCAGLVSGIRTFDASLLRSLLPEIYIPAAARLPWKTILPLLSAAWAIGSYFPITRTAAADRPWLAYSLITGPVLAAAAVMPLSPEHPGVIWVFCAASIAGFLAADPVLELRGMWLSAVAMTAYRPLATDEQWCLLLLAVGAGWALAWKSRDAHPLWEGLGLLGIGLWSYKMSGNHLTLSYLTASEGGSAHPHLLCLLALLKPFLVVAAPVLPRLAIRPLYSVLGIVPLLAAFSAGNLTMMWWDQFMNGNTQKLTDTTEFAQTQFVLVLAWLMIGAWVCAQALLICSQRSRQSWSVAESSTGGGSSLA